MPSPVRITISAPLVEQIRVMSEAYAQSTAADPAPFYADYYLNLIPHARAIAPLGSGLGIKPGARVVEIGSGMGTRCLLGRGLWGAEMTGIEPCANTYGPLDQAIAELRACNPLLPYDSQRVGGEDTSLPSDSFDFALSFEVLEHVADPAKVVAEAFRILKPCGSFYFSTSNYHSFYEGHYRCPWWPTLNRTSAARWVRVLGYNERFIDELNFITRAELERHLAAAGFEPPRWAPAWPAVEDPVLEVSYPEGFQLPRYRRRRSRIQSFVQRPAVHRFLAHFQLEYKLHALVQKPSSPRAR